MCHDSVFVYMTMTFSCNPLDSRSARFGICFMSSVRARAEGVTVHTVHQQLHRSIKVHMGRSGAVIGRLGCSLSSATKASRGDSCSPHSLEQGSGGGEVPKSSPLERLQAPLFVPLELRGAVLLFFWLLFVCFA